MMQFHVQLVSCARYADSVADALCALSNNNNNIYLKSNSVDYKNNIQYVIMATQYKFNLYNVT